jgi:hypothetical protein
MLRITIAIVVFSICSAAAQEPFSIENHIQGIISIGDEVENRAYYDLLLFYYDNPIDLNRGTVNQFSQLAFLNEEQIAAIIKHRAESGSFQSIYELQSIEGFSVDIIQTLLPFITLSDNQSIINKLAGTFRGKTNYFTSSYGRVIQPSRGFKESIYRGSPDRAQFRLRFRNPGKISIGLAAQKDPGEQWLNQHNNSMPDHYTGHIYIEKHKRLNQLVIGDYRMQYGQGLLLGAGFMAGKNVETVTSVKQASLGILPFSSISETQYFRGIGANIGISNQLSLSLFYSNQGLDATPTSYNLKPAVSAIRKSGLHRTTNEIESINQVNEQIWGSALRYQHKNFSTGAIVMTTQFNKPIVPTPTNYNQYQFNGKSLTNYSWFGQYNIGNILVFGEVAKTHHAGMALSAGVISSISKYISLSLFYRKFDKDFHSFYGQSFSERSTLNNEEGIYWGIKLSPTKKMLISAYYDMYKFGWISSSTAAPALGNDYLLRISYAFSKTSTAFVQFRNEQQPRKENTGIVAINRNERLIKSIANIDYNKEAALSYRTRIQYNLNPNDNERSWLMLQDINYSTMKLGFTARVLVFDVPSFETRQFVYEKDMLFSYLTRGFIGRGISYYAIVKYKPHPKISVRAKWSLTEYLNQNSIGSGYDVIDGNYKTQLTAQIHLRF